MRKKLLKDSVMQLIKSPSLEGQLSLAHDYGIVPMLVDSTHLDPLSVFSTRGDLLVQSFQLPVRITYNYSTLQLPFGLNNYFRVNVDFQAMAQRRQAMESKINGVYGQDINVAKLNADSLTGKIGYAQVMQDYAAKRLEQEKQKLEAMELSQQQLPDSLKTGSRADSLQMQRQQLIEKIAYYEHMRDTLQETYEQIHALQELYQDQAANLENMRSKDLQTLRKGAMMMGQDQLGPFLSGFRKFNLGLSYPKTTGLSNSSIAVKGIDLEHQQGKWYTAVTAGLTVNNQQPTNNLYQNSLNNVQNNLNFFDFQALHNNLLLTAIKTGLGGKDDKHLHVGFRHMSQPQFLTTSSSLPFTPSYAVELDGRLTLKQLPNLNVDLVYGKTNPKSPDSTGSQGFLSQRTHTALVKLNQRLPRLKSEITATWRWIDAQADTRNMGVLQGDNARIEVQGKQRLGKRLQMSVTYRNDHNNLDKRQDSTLNIYLAGSQMQWTIGRLFNLSGGFTYLESGKKNREGERGPIQQNYLINGVLATMYSMKHTQAVATISYSDNYLATANGLILFKNMGIQHSILSKTITWTVAWNQFETNQTHSSDSLLTSPSLQIWSTQLEWKLKKINLKAGFRYAPQNSAMKYGYSAELLWNLNKLLTFSAKLDKPVPGDYYNSFIIDRYREFPYTIQSKMIVHLNYTR